MTKLKVTLKRSTIGASKKQVATIRGLGLRKINHSRELLNTPSIRGMVKQVLHWVDVEEIEKA